MEMNMITAIEHYTCDDTGMTVYHRGNGWEDEDGIARGPKPPRYTPAPASADKKVMAEVARAEVKKVGDYRALSSGTPKQKAWAETIRTEIVSKMPVEVRGHFVHITSAKFWIDNRDESIEFWTAEAKEPAKKTPKKPAAKGVARRAKAIINKNLTLQNAKNRAPQWTQAGREAQAAAFEHLEGQDLEAFLIEMMTVHCFRQGPDLHAGRAAIKERFNIASDVML
jgi:hypothetical protein